jgi:hypothetical protein
MPNQMVDLLASWSGRFGSHRYLDAWRMAPHCVMWCIWNGHNSCNFEDIGMVITLKDLFLKTFYGWMVAINS